MPYSSRSRYRHERIENPKKFDNRSFRTIPIKPGVKAVIGCPVGKYNPTTRKCNVGTRIQKILHEKKMM